MPTLIVAGALDDPEIFRVANLMANEIKGAHKVIIPDIAQMQNTENPQTSRKVVLSFLDGLKKS